MPLAHLESLVTANRILGREIYSERPSHGGLYEARPDAMAVAHNHSPPVAPFGVTGMPLRLMFYLATLTGDDIAAWGTRDNFGDTNMLVTTRPQGHDLAAALTNREP